MRRNLGGGHRQARVRRRVTETWEVVTPDGRITLRSTRLVCKVIQKDLRADGIESTVRPVPTSNLKETA